MRVVGVGVGAGSKDFDGHPNVLRVILGTVGDVEDARNFIPAGEKKPVLASVSSAPLVSVASSKVPSSPVLLSAVEASSGPRYEWSTLSELSCNVDDMTGEVMSYVVERAFALGALDAWATPIVMKKGRPAATLHFLVNEKETEKVEALTDMVFRETTTLGIRMGEGIRRAALKRDFFRGVQTPFSNSECDGKVDVKVGFLGDEVVTVHPEFEDCKKVAIATGAPLKDVIDFARLKVMEERRGGGGSSTR